MFRYINKKTGAYFDSPCKATGANWALEEDLRKEEDTGKDKNTDKKEGTNKDAGDDAEKNDESYTAEELNKMTVDELKELANKNKIEFTKDDKKVDLIELIAAELN